MTTEERQVLLQIPTHDADGGWLAEWEREALARRLVKEQVVTDKRTDSKCGTYAGWYRHGRRGETPCGPCLAAQRAYHRDYLARNPEVRERRRLENAARSRAMTRLAAESRARFRELYNEELAR